MAPQHTKDEFRALQCEGLLGGGGEDTGVLMRSILTKEDTVLFLPGPEVGPGEIDDVDDLCREVGAKLHILLSGRDQIIDDKYRKHAARVFENATILVVPGGNFPRAIKDFRRAGLLDLMRTFVLNPNKQIVGMSLGTVWLAFECDTRDRDYDEENDTDLPRLIPGANVVPTLMCAHADSINEYAGVPRTVIFAHDFTRASANNPRLIGVAIENMARLRIEGGRVYFVGTPGAKVTRFSRDPASDEVVTHEFATHTVSQSVEWFFYGIGKLSV